MRLRKRKLEMILSHLSRHPDPDPRLEQYDISPQAAARIITVAWDRGDIENRRVCDLGCGTGMLAIAAALCGAKEVVGIDIDPLALETAQENINIAQAHARDVVSTRVKLIENDVARVDIQETGRFDTAVQNPPFGVQTRSSDRVFLRKGLELSPVLYSLHKRDEGVERFVNAYVWELGGAVQDKIGIEVSIPHQFDFHRKPKYVVLTDLFIIRRKDIGSEKDTDR